MRLWPSENMLLLRLRIAGPALLALLLAGACRTASIHTPAVRMHLAVEPTLVHAGETVRIELTLTNPRSDTLLLEFADDCRVTFLVLDASQGATAPQGPITRCVQPGAGRLLLPAGAAWKAEEEWRASAEDGEPLPAGPYVVRAVLGEHYAVHGGTRDFKLGHAADTVVIRVLPRREE